MKKIITALLLIASIHASAQTKVIAHRGFWDTEGSAQNSIASLQKADKIKVYGSEFDVKMTSDGVLVINHDDDINGKLIEETPYADIKDVKLKNGETLPTLEQYLKEGKKNKYAKMILELKHHNTNQHEDRAVAAVVAMVKKYGMENRVEYISFSMNTCKGLIEQSPKTPVSYLNGDMSPKELKELGFAGIDYHYKVFEAKPEWIKEAHDLGMITNVWTVNDADKMRTFIAQGIQFITTDKPVELEKILQETK